MMTQNMKIELNKRIEKAKKINISVQGEIDNVRGVYCFYAKKKTEEIPFYVGKSDNIIMRMYGKNGHIYGYLRGLRKTKVQKRMEEYLNEKYEIEVRILKEVPYKGDSFIQDANILALAELEEIVKLQNEGYCITEDQISEAVKRQAEEKNWNKWYLCHDPWKSGACNQLS